MEDLLGGLDGCADTRQQEEEGEQSQQETDAGRQGAAQLFQEILPSRQSGFKTLVPEELRALGCIGSGAQATVFKAEWTRSFGSCTSTIIVAVKKLHPALGILYRDRELLTMNADHPNLVKCFDYTMERPYLIVSEFCAGGSLSVNLYRPDATIAVRQITKILTDIAAGMSFLHEQCPPFLHRDLKSANVLLAKQIRKPSQVPSAKVADFGLTRASRTADESMMTVGVGTWRWMAPEIFASEGDDEDPYDTGVDVFSFAIVIYECLAQQLPYADEYPLEKVDPRISLRICQGLRPNQKLIRPDAPQELVDLMEEAWDDNVTRRPPFSESLRRLQRLAAAFED